jgi:hypothetical protein
LENEINIPLIVIYDFKNLNKKIKHNNSLSDLLIYLNIIDTKPILNETINTYIDAFFIKNEYFKIKKINSKLTIINDFYSIFLQNLQKENKFKIFKEWTAIDKFKIKVPHNIIILKNLNLNFLYKILKNQYYLKNNKTIKL